MIGTARLIFNWSDLNDSDFSLPMRNLRVHSFERASCFHTSMIQAIKLDTVASWSDYFYIYSTENMTLNKSRFKTTPVCLIPILDTLTSCFHGIIFGVSRIISYLYVFFFLYKFICAHIFMRAGPVSDRDVWSVLTIYSLSPLSHHDNRP